MSETLERLRTKYPHYKVISEPDPACNCGGKGELRIKPSELFPAGRDAPCLCICLSGDGRADVTKALGNAAKKVYDDHRPTQRCIVDEPKYRATIEIPEAAYEQIAITLAAMGHDHCFMEEGGIVPFAMRFVPRGFKADTGSEHE